jgi:excisionase family DNA binding protein
LQDSNNTKKYLLTLTDTLRYNKTMNEEIKENSIYTTAEVEKLLKISPSTMKRLLKKGLIRANKIGRQYRIMGKEILRTISPDIERQAVSSYQTIKKNTKEKLRNW